MPQPPAKSRLVGTNYRWSQAERTLARQPIMGPGKVPQVPRAVLSLQQPSKLVTCDKEGNEAVYFLVEEGAEPAMAVHMEEESVVADKNMDSVEATLDV